MVFGKNSLVVPNKISFIEVAAIPLSSNTMINMLKALELNLEDTLLIAGDQL